MGAPIKRLSVHSYPDASHYILEDMREEVVPLIEDFLTRSEMSAL
jgi:cis-3-alkyl-4-acyloxetan-2-one decarboxylase